MGRILTRIIADKRVECHTFDMFPGTTRAGMRPGYFGPVKALAYATTTRYRVAGIPRLPLHYLPRRLPGYSLRPTTLVCDGRRVA